MDSNIVRKMDNSPIGRLKAAISAESVQQQFKNALKENAGLFIASLIDVYASDTYLQTCSPKDVIMEALKAATLKLPINKSLGFAYIVPYKGKATMIIGYKGYLQLAQRTAQYRFINADIVYEGEKVTVDRLTGEVYFSGEAISDEGIGYFAHIETLNGFRKTVFWTKEKIIGHAKKYSQSYDKDKGPWKTQFDAMAIKTVLKHLLTKYGIMSVDMAQAIDMDAGDYQEAKAAPAKKVNATSYDATEKPPESLENGSGDQNQSSPPLDEYGMSLDSPWEKSKWFNLKQSGFGIHVKQHEKELITATPKCLEIVKAKYLKLFGQNLELKQPDQKDGGQPQEDQGGADMGENLNENYKDDGEGHGADPGDDQQGLFDEHGSPEEEKNPLESDAARVLADLSRKEPLLYQQIVRNQVPDTVADIIDWIDQINEAIVARSSGR